MTAEAGVLVRGRIRRWRKGPQARECGWPQTLHKVEGGSEAGGRGHELRSEDGPQTLHKVEAGSEGGGRGREPRSANGPRRCTR